MVECMTTRLDQHQGIVLRSCRTGTRWSASCAAGGVILGSISANVSFFEVVPYWKLIGALHVRHVQRIF